MKVATLQKILTNVNGFQTSFFAMTATFITPIIKESILLFILTSVFQHFF